jgi:hypothetical protein
VLFYNTGGAAKLLPSVEALGFFDAPAPVIIDKFSPPTFELDFSSFII